jgi:predicted DNA-binding transcriptional regulator AlpA
MTELLTTNQVLKRLKVSRATLSRWRQNGGGPAFIQMGPRTVRYSRESVHEFEQKATRLKKAEQMIILDAITGPAQNTD